MTFNTQRNRLNCCHNQCITPSASKHRQTGIRCTPTKADCFRRPRRQPTVSQLLQHKRLVITASILRPGTTTTIHPQTSLAPIPLLNNGFRLSSPYNLTSSSNSNTRHGGTHHHYKNVIIPSAIPNLNPAHAAIAAAKSIHGQFDKLEGLWPRFIPMSCLFFLMAFINTIIDSLKDSLVITAVGGGTEVIPYLTVYAVLPSSFLFLFAYSWGTQKFSRETLFNIIVTLFLSFYGGFALLYPFHESLHLGASADALVSTLPIGLAGMVGMVRNWLFTLFYCVSELWGDVVLSLLFWGLANETTSIEDAPLLYPLFGIGANIAQTLAGRVLRVFSGDTSANAALVDNLSYTSQLQSILMLCLGLGAAILLLHTYISRTFPRNPKGYTAAKMRKAAAQVALDAEKNMAAASNTSNTSNGGNGGVHKSVKIDLEASVKGLNYCDLTTKSTMDRIDGDTSTSSNGGSGGDRAVMSSSSSTSTSTATTTSKTKEAMSMKDAWYFLKASPQIRCLAVMALAQGITTNLLDLAWKHYLHKLATTPAAYSAILGDTAMWTGIVTGTLMFASPALFDRMGWRGVASATPNLMMWGGLPFFAGCVAYTFAGTALTAKGVSALALSVIVVTGALLQIFSRGAKFSLFKPAEEMVYIGLDDESRTKGKAAIDVVGAQSGKSAGSVLQQLLLIISGGTFGGILPVMALFYGCMLNTWTNAVDDLAEHYDPQHAHRASVLASLDEDEDEKGDGEGVMERGGEVTPLPTPA